MSELNFTFTRAFTSFMIFKKTSACLLLAFVLFIQVLKAQVTITIPSNNLYSSGLAAAEWRKPFGTFFGYERSAMLYQHTEIGQYGNITSLAFYCDTVNLPGNVPLTIYMKEVASTSFSVSTHVSQEENGAQLVYTGTLPSTSFVKGQWITIPLTNPFFHTSSNSIEVVIETNAGGTGNETALGKGFYHYVTSANTFQYWTADNSAPSGLGTLSTKRPNVQFIMNVASGCSGLPNGGTTLASVDTTCSTVTLFLNGASIATGLTYQWQDSLAGGAWTNIPGGANSILNTGIQDNTWFRCQVSCASQTASSSVKEVVKKSYLQCYCNADLGGGCTSSAIDSVALGGLGLVTSATGCSANNYTMYPAAPGTCAQLVNGQNYNLYTRFNGNVIASVWIDYDQSGSFDTLEWKQIATATTAGNEYVTVIAVPASAKNGLTRMRIRSRAAGNINGSSSACDNFGSGETEDYFVGINYDVSVGSIKKDAEVVLYPNPASQSIWLAGNLAKGEPLTVKIYSITGLLESESAIVFSGEPLRFDVSQLSRGAHFIKVAGTRVNLVKKFVLVD